MKRDRYFKSLTALNILILCATIAIRLGAPAHAKAQTLSSQSGAEDLKSLDDFFNDHDNLALSGCDPTTWAVIHLAAQLALQEQELPMSGAKSDIVRDNEIRQCLDIVTDKERSNEIDFHKSLHAQAKELTDIFKNTIPGPEAAKALAESIQTKHREYSDLLDKGGRLQDIIGFAELASRKYLTCGRNSVPQPCRTLQRFSE